MLLLRPVPLLPCPLYTCDAACAPAHSPGCRLFGIPSYHVQQMLATHLGLEYIDTAVSCSGGGGGGGAPAADTLAAGASCLNAACDEVAVKLVNFSADRQLTRLHFVGVPPGSLGASGQLMCLTSQQPLDENTFDAPNKVGMMRTAQFAMFGPLLACMRGSC